MTFTLEAPIDNRAAPSAKGLFRATGNTGRDDEREAADFYPTPPEPTRAFLAAENDRLRDFPLIWEPAAGDGAMVREIKRAGHQVYASDLINRGAGAELRSFYDYEAAPGRAVVTNPPYQEINWRDGRARWLRYGWEVLNLDYMACLLSWSWPGAGGHGSHWAQYPPARVYLMRWKIDFTGGGAPPMLNAWFVWDRAWKGETVLRMLDRHQDGASDQADMFGGAA